MRFGSVCSGIEAASVAWHPLGWKAAWLSEIEPFPSAVLKHHYPDVPNLGDMTTLPERILSGEVEAPDVFCGGTPCQAFSVAGLRKSLDDARGNLSLTFVGIANAIDHVRSVRSANPAIIFWENVPGVLNTKDNAFGCFLAALAGEDDALVPSGQKWTNAGCVFGPQRTVAWRVLDAQYFGVAQRRRRVFVVASARADFDPTKVLFEFEGMRRDTAPSREKGQRVAPSTGASASGRSWPAEVSSTLDTTFGTKQGLEDQHVNAGCPLFVPAISPCLETQVGGFRQPCTQAYVVTPPLTASMSTPLGNGGKDAFITAVMQPINIYGGNKRPDRPEGGFYVRMDEETSKTLDAATGLNPTCSQGGTAVMQPISFSGQMSNPHTDVDIMQTLQAKNPMAVAFGGDIARTLQARHDSSPCADRGMDVVAVMQPAYTTKLHNTTSNQSGKVYEEYSTSLDANSPPPAVFQPISIQDVRPVEKAQNGRGWNDDGTAYTVDTHATQGVAFNIAPGKGELKDDIHVTDAHISKTIDASGSNPSMHQGGSAIVQTMQVRRLTPVECERLQGFPDNYTDIKAKGKPTPDGPRYKALGNSWAVPVVRWIGSRIAQEVQRLESIPPKENP